MEHKPNDPTLKLVKENPSDQNKAPRVDLTKPDASSPSPSPNRNRTRNSAVALLLCASAISIIQPWSHQRSDQKPEKPCTQQAPALRVFSISGLKLGDLQSKHGPEAQATATNEIRDYFGTFSDGDSVKTPALTEWTAIVHSEGTANDPADVQSVIRSVLQNMGINKEDITPVQAPAFDPGRQNIDVAEIAVWQQVSAPCPSNPN